MCLQDVKFIMYAYGCTHAHIQIPTHLTIPVLLTVCMLTFADMFLKHPNLKDLRILRIYSKSIETKYHYGPHSSKVW